MRRRLNSNLPLLLCTPQTAALPPSPPPPSLPNPGASARSWKMNAGYLQTASMDQLTQLGKMTS